MRGLGSGTRRQVAVKRAGSGGGAAPSEKPATLSTRTERSSASVTHIADAHRLAAAR